MSLFDESEVEAGHERLASSVSVYINALAASADLTRKILLAESQARRDPEMHANYLTASNLGFRVVNGIGAATKLLDCGYFIQAAAIGRDIAEVGMLALYFAEKPEMLSEWRRIPGKSRYDKFGRSKLKSSIQAKPKFAFLNVYFELFSEFGSHPSSASVIAHHDGHRFQSGPHINEQLYVTLHSDIAHLTWHVVDAFGDTYRALFLKDPRDLFPTETDRFQNLLEGIGRGETAN